MILSIFSALLLLKRATHSFAPMIGLSLLHFRVPVMIAVQLSTTIFRKKTHTDNYLPFESHHPLSHRVSVIRSLYGRPDRLCCTVKDRDTEKEHIESALISNGYPRHIISKYNAPSRRREGEERENPKASIVILYVRNLSESIRRILTRCNIRTCFKPNTTLRNLLVHPKDRIPSTSKRGVVY